MDHRWNPAAYSACPVDAGQATAALAEMMLPVRLLTASGARVTGYRIGVVLRALCLLSKGNSLRAAAKQMRLPVSTIHGWLRLYFKGGLRGLVRGGSTGRRTVVQRLSITDQELASIAGYIGNGRGVPGACLAYASQPGIRRELADYLANHRVPIQLHKAVMAARQKGAAK